MCRISQSLKSVSHVPENSESLVCVYVMNTSILLICVNRIEYHRVSSLCRTYRLSWSKFIFLPCWISLMLSSVFCHAEYLRSWDLCHHLVKISELRCCVNHEEYLRFWSLCQMCRISQNLESVWQVPENSESQVCVNVMNTSILLICVKRLEYLRVSSLCHTCWISQSLKFVSMWRISQYSWSVSYVRKISESQVCVSRVEYLCTCHAVCL